MRTIILILSVIVSVPLSSQEVLAPGIINISDAGSYAPTFIDQNTLCFTRGGQPSTILISTRVDGKWTEPVVAPFSGKYADENPNYDPASSVLVFSSKRPNPNDSIPSANDLWFVMKMEDGWSEPMHLDGSFSSPGIDGSGVVSGEQLYFHSDRAGKGINSVDLYVLNCEHNFKDAEKLSISTDKVDGEPYFFNEGKSMLFMSAGYDSAGESDIFLSIKRGDTWLKPISIDNTGQVNSPKWEYTPRLSPDMRTLYFTRWEDSGPVIMYIDLADMKSPVLRHHLKEGK